ncbi:hypothetical protein M422DRAFT_63174 [Sphaerobolus stellatus SS14]|nr:hypothetical protein M422DRAFT_63174 [Sphaerobolus stellatus SS14]
MVVYSSPSRAPLRLSDPRIHVRSSVIHPSSLIPLPPRYPRCSGFRIQTAEAGKSSSIRLNLSASSTRRLMNSKLVNKEYLAMPTENSLGNVEVRRKFGELVIHAIPSSRATRALAYLNSRGRTWSLEDSAALVVEFDSCPCLGSKINLSNTWRAQSSAFEFYLRAGLSADQPNSIALG